MENPNMPITKCGLINLCYIIHTRFISTHFFQILVDLSVGFKLDEVLTIYQRKKNEWIL